MKRVAAAPLIRVLGVLALVTVPGVPLSSQSLSSIRGRVLTETGAPLRHARVQIVASSAAISVPVVLTDVDGRFVLDAVPAGEYRISASKPGYVTTAFGARRPRDAGATLVVPDRNVIDNVDVRLPRAAALSGRILDTQGDPVIGLLVSAELPQAGAAPPIDRRTGTPGTTVATARTDDQGMFRLGGLADGRYIVAVNITGLLLGPNGAPLDGTIGLTTTVDGRPQTFSSDSIPTTRMYFPGTTNFAEAQPLALEKGEERTSIDFLTAPPPPPRSVVQLLADRANSQRAAPPTYRSSIQGVVTTADGRPLSQAIVRASTEDAPAFLAPSTVTDENGRYSLPRLAAGAYRVEASRSGFLTTVFGQRTAQDDGDEVRLAANEARERVDIAMLAPAAISGQIVDEFGDPVEGALIRVLKTRYESGQRRLVDVGGLGSRRTDDQGRYRIYGLQPGDYRVSAMLGQFVPALLSTDVPGYAPSYFPGTTNAADARLVRLDPGQPQTGIDFAIMPVPTARVSGSASDSEGNPVQGSISLTPSRRSGSLVPTSLGARTSRDGRFEFPNVPPGDYILQVTKTRVNPYTEGEFVGRFVTVNGADVSGLTMRMSKGSRVAGRITLEGPQPADFYSRIDLVTIPTDLDRSPLIGNQPASAEVARDLTFKMAGLSGPRLFRVRQAPRGWMLKAILLNGRDVTDTPLPFGSDDQSIANLEVVLTNQSTEISGTLADARGRPLASKPVIIFATDRQLWVAASRFVAMTKTARDGSFSVIGLPAGEYLAAAVDRLEDGDWQDPEVLSALATGALRFGLGDGQKVAVVLRGR